MKKFDLEQAKQGKKVVTRDGREVEQLVEFKSIGEFCVVGVVNGVMKSWNKSGEEWRNNKSPNDLFMATEKKTVWVKVYTMSGGVSGMYMVSNGHADIETLNRIYHDNEKYICTKSIEIEV